MVWLLKENEAGKGTHTDEDLQVSASSSAACDVSNYLRVLLDRINSVMIVKP